MGKELKLQPRLACLASLVPDNARLADVGTDHGYVPVFLLQQGRIVSAIASDIGREPLEHAVRTSEEYGKKDKLSFRLCAGLDAIAPQEVDTILIAGMGGETIIEILAAARWTKGGDHCLILQPQTKIEEFRIWLLANGYTFLQERLVLDKEKLYVVFVVRGGFAAEECSLLDSYAGRCLTDDPLYGEYLARQIKRLRLRESGLRQGGRSEANLSELIRALEEKREEWDNGKG